jgi:hypothetical protein
MRAAVKHIDGAWVRVSDAFADRWGDYHQAFAWAGGRYGPDRGMAEIKAALEAAGLTCVCNGRPGTEGAHIVDVVLNPACAVATPI